MSVSNSNANKENVNQGNEEVTDEKRSEEEYVVDGLLNEEEFNKKYTELQSQWLDGHRKEEELTAEEKARFGEHSYILKYCLGQKADALNQEIVFHPKTSYSYTDFEKSAILPLMKEDKLRETQERFQGHIDRLEEKILRKIKEREAETAKEKEEAERKEKEDAESEETKSKKKKAGWVVPPYCVPIRADIRQFDFEGLAKKQKELSGRLFDVIMTDPPWMLATANPTRGVALGYSQLSDDIITSLPIPLLQENGLLFIWVINAKYRLALQLFMKWGYTMIGDVSWVKQTVNRRIANGHGYYLQHAKETCLIGLKGDFDKIPSLNNKKIKGVCSDVIYSERRGQSQKPEEIYQYVEQLVPKGYYLEIFARRNNLRNGWFSIGNEL